VSGVVANRIRDIGGLIDHAGSYRAGIDLDQSDDIRVFRADEVGDLLQHATAAAKVAGARNGQVEADAGAGGVSNVVDEQSHVGQMRPYADLRFAQYTGCMSQRDPIRVFVTHCFEEGDDYLRVFEYLESARNFYYRNCSVPGAKPNVPSPDAIRDELRRQVARSEVVVALTGLHETQPDLLIFQINCGKALDKPVVLLPLFGREQPKLKVIDGLVDDTIRWDERALVDAVRRQARHEDTQRWDTIEFKLD
jgi:hypothetical protein